MIKVQGHRIEPTIFPDETTQVWKLPAEVLSAATVHVDWRFEHEAELFQVGHHVADRRGRKVQSGVARQGARTHRLALGDVALDQRLQQVLRAFVEHGTIVHAVRMPRCNPRSAASP